MDDYSEQRHNIIITMAKISQWIDGNRKRIEAERRNIKESEEAIVRDLKEIDKYEVELKYLMGQLKDEFQE